MNFLHTRGFNGSDCSPAELLCALAEGIVVRRHQKGKRAERVSVFLFHMGKEEEEERRGERRDEIGKKSAHCTR